jgi:hypothetical protein
MVSRKTLALGLTGLAAVAVASRRYRQDSATPRVEYDTLTRIDDVEIRRYPRTIVVETTARSENAAFYRLFRYISGENESAADVSMTAPVESTPEAGESVATTAPAESESVEMTAPVESETGDEGVRMAFYLPEEYDYDSAPRPTDDAVRLVERPGRTLAVLGFSWWATESRVERKTDDLLSTLAEAEASFDVVGEPVLMRYEGPWVPPFLRTNEVAVPVRRASSA